MKPLLKALVSLVVCAALAAPAVGHDTTGSGPSTTTEQWQPEEAYTFRVDGKTYAVWNTHRRNFLGYELIEVRGADGVVVVTWRTRRGWCFTQEAYLTSHCMSHGHYESFFVRQVRAALAPPVPSVHLVFPGSGPTSVLDDYPCLEKRLSTNTPSSTEMTPPEC